MKINKEYSLYIVHYQVETKLLFIYSQQHSESLYEQIASGFSNDFIQFVQGLDQEALDNGIVKIGEKNNG